ncbi:phospholipid carrier-dependent glycosyltransferase [Hydrogenimonas sp. SS33]|uniref:ArnT family glycosyltransferase n=1 Tax=Hydrogenimonas leucolamina TaxID=2954236 RepID=UPI00336BD9C2
MAALSIDRKTLLLLLFAAVVLLIGAGSYGVIETSDARYAEIAREMLQSRDWLHPSLLGIHHYHKPPLTYQITALGYGLWGINPFGARFFLQMSVVLQLLLIYLTARRLGLDARVARWAAAVYFSFPLVLASSRTLTTDSFLTTFALAAVYSWVGYRREGRARWLYLLALWLGLGFLTKGPVILIAPVLFALFWRPETAGRAAPRYHKLFAAALFVLLSASWFLYLARENPAFWSYFIERQTIQRFGSNVFHRHEPFWYYWLYAPLVGLPWLAALPWLWARAEAGGEKKLLRALLLAGLAGMLFFSLSSSKRILYILPLFGFFALAVAMLIDRLGASDAERLERGVKAYAVGIALLFAAAPWLPLPGVHLPAVVTLYALGALLALAGLGRWKIFSKSRAVLAAVIASTLLLLAATATLSRSPESFKIADPVARWIRARHLQERTVLVYDRRLPSLAFTLKKPIVSLYDCSRDLDRETRFEKDERWRENLYNLKDPKERKRLKRALSNTDYLLVLFAKKLPENRRWLIEKLPHVGKIGRWTVYY